VVAAAQKMANQFRVSTSELTRYNLDYNLNIKFEAADASAKMRMRHMGGVLRHLRSGLLSPALAFSVAAPLLAHSVAAVQVAAPPESSSSSAHYASSSTHNPTDANGAEGLIKLDVVVMDETGKPESGLDPQDFTLLENGQPQKILSFRGFDGISAKPDSSVEVIFVIDTLDTPPILALHERGEVARFLKQNDGRLRHQTSIFGLSENGVWTVEHPSGDGNTLAEDLVHNNERFLLNYSPRRNLRGEPLDSLVFGEPAIVSAWKALGFIATEERRKPGRKLLVWVGPGCGIGSGMYPDASEGQHNFDLVYWFSTLLRDARIAICDISVGESDSRSQLYKEYLSGVKTVRQASLMYVYRKVLAVESGGQVLDAGGDLVRQIDACVRGSNTFFTISFNPAPAAYKDEYHDLKVEVGRPGLQARTITGYYDQPFYSDEPSPATRRVTIAQLEQTLTGTRGESDGEVARELSGLELTERAGDEKVASWMAEMHSKKIRQMLRALADASEFREPPGTDIPSEASPDENAQRQMISLAADYLSSTISRLPDFLARRTSVRYEEAPPYDEGITRVDPEPLHVVDQSKATVLYRNGFEVLEAKTTKRGTGNRYLITYGTFGPLLSSVKDAIAVPGGLTWTRWEQRVNGRYAVFRFAVPKENEKSAYEAAGCCLPDGDGMSGFEKRTSYHGEIAIDPASGAILRMEIQADLQGFVPLDRSDIMVEYGPIEIGGKTYICPIRSVSLWRARSVPTLWEWNEGFKTWGPYATMLNDFAFDDYHIFRSSSRMLPEYTQAPQQK
jgi:VWFA-related protein